MILLAWRFVVRWVIGARPDLWCDETNCWKTKSPICIRGHCRRCCEVDSRCKCEDKLSPEELQMVAEYRATTRPQLRAVRP